MPLPIPGAGEFVWFIYGSSLDRDAFAAWAREHGYAPPDFTRAFAARLEGWRLSFDVTSRFWGGAVGSLAVAPGLTVEGLAVALPGMARPLADHKEGVASSTKRTTRPYRWRWRAGPDRNRCWSTQLPRGGGDAAFPARRTRAGCATS
jgi:hypothetical protein